MASALGTGGRVGPDAREPLLCFPQGSPCICVRGRGHCQQSTGCLPEESRQLHRGEQAGRGPPKSSPGPSFGCVFTAEPAGHRVGQHYPRVSTVCGLSQDPGRRRGSETHEGGRTTRRLRPGLPPSGLWGADRMGSVTPWLRMAGPPACLRPGLISGLLQKLDEVLRETFKKAWGPGRRESRGSRAGV